VQPPVWTEAAVSRQHAVEHRGDFLDVPEGYDLGGLAGSEHHEAASYLPFTSGGEHVLKTICVHRPGVVLTTVRYQGAEVLILIEVDPVRIRADVLRKVGRVLRPGRVVEDPGDCRRSGRVHKIIHFRFSSSMIIRMRSGITTISLQLRQHLLS